jgi:hypothetical protein
MYKKLEDVTLQSLKKHSTLIHYFGLGFIQIKLGPKYRIHFYTEELPAIIDDEDVHNHRYNFTSHIFAGKFTQDIYIVTDGDTHELEQESCKEGVESHEKALPCGIKKIMSQTFNTGSSYHIDHSVFHTVSAKDAITFLERGPVAKELAEVIRKKDAPKVCPFSKKIPEEELWKIVEKILIEKH